MTKALAENHKETRRNRSRAILVGRYVYRCSKIGSRAGRPWHYFDRYSWETCRDGIRQGWISRCQYLGWSWFLARGAAVPDQDIFWRLENEIGSGPSFVLWTWFASSWWYVPPWWPMIDVKPYLLSSEPSNMLDVPSITFLSNYLQSYPSTVLVVSHDRAFLNEVATDIIHQHSERLDYYKGANFGKSDV